MWQWHGCPQVTQDRFQAALADHAPTGYGLIAGPLPNARGETDIVFDEQSGHWGLDNGEYAGPIFYCPWCGVDLRDDTR